ncbi:MAG TPA: hypothetical protein VGG61_15545, partial [Gemmataceae bacterium]
MSKLFLFSALATADLVIDAVYEGGTQGNSADDVLDKLIPGTGNQSDFRAVGSRGARAGLPTESQPAPTARQKMRPARPVAQKRAFGWRRSGVVELFAERRFV